MNLLHLLQIPWHATYRSLRWLALSVLTLCGGAAIGIGLFGGRSDRFEVAIALFGFGVLFLWAFFLSTSLLLAIDARRLRVPHIQRQIVASLLLYAVLSIALPTLLLGVIGAPVFNAAVVLALLGTGGLAFALMPRYFAVFIGLTPALANTLWSRMHLPGVGDPRFVHAALPVTLLLLLAIVVYWRRLLRAGSSRAQGWSSPMVLQYRNGSWGHWNTIGDLGQLRRRPDWLQLAVSLDGVGPTAPRKALRVALGGWYLPQTARSYARQLGLLFVFAVLPLLAVALLIHWGQNDNQIADILRGLLIGSLGMTSVCAGPMVGVLSLLWLSKRWQGTHAELPLLALLPGLGDPAQARRQVVRAGLGLPLALHALLLLLVGIAMLCWHGHGVMLSFLLLAQLGAAAVTVALLLNLFGGRRLSIWTNGSVLAASFMLTLLSLLLPAMSWGRDPVAGAQSALLPLVVAWMLLAAGMIWLARRGWRELVQRPHPFLPG